MESDSYTDLSETVNDVMGRVSEAKSRCTKSSDVMVVAVSKTKPKQAIMEAYSFGCRHFGENYVNELLEKALDSEILEMCPDIKWHFIGHLQSNKVNKVVGIPNLYMIQTVDSTKLADAIDKAWAKLLRPYALKIMVQVNTSGESSKSGIASENCALLVEHIIKECSNLELSGLMTIGYAHYDTKLAPNPEFQMLIKLKEEIMESFPCDNLHLSMGMSNDFEHAIELGSTCVRVGRCLFGERVYT